MHVVRRNKLNRARALTDWNSDLLAIGQSNNQRRAGHWRSHRRGVGNHTAFSDAWGSGQGDRRGVDGVSNLSNGRSAIYGNVLEVAASGTGHSDADFASVDVHVIGRSRHGDAAFGLARGNGDDFTVAQSDLHFRAGWIGQCGGINNRTALSD